MKTIIGKDKSSVNLTGVSGTHYHFLPHNVISSILIGEKHLPKIFLIVNKEENENGELMFQPIRIGMVNDLEALIEKVFSLYKERVGTGSFYYSDFDNAAKEDRLNAIVIDIINNRDEYPHLVLVQCSSTS